MVKDFEFKTPKDVIEELLVLPIGTSIDFTFDSPEEAKFSDFEPSGWYGVKIVEIDGFGEKEKCVVSGMWGMGILYCSTDVDRYSDCLYSFEKFCRNEGLHGRELCVSKKYNGN